MLVLLVTALLETQSSLMKCLKECETKYRKLAKRSGDAILHNAADGTVRNASPSIMGLTGIDAAVLFGFNAHAVVHAENVEIVWNSHLRALANRHNAYSAIPRTGLAGRTWFEASMRAIVTEDGESVGVIGSIRDITDRKTAGLELTSAANIGQRPVWLRCRRRGAAHFCGGCPAPQLPERSNVPTSFDYLHYK